MPMKNGRTKLSRRKALKGIGTSSFGVLGSGVAMASPSDDRIVITTMKAGDKPIEQKSVPKNWYDQQQYVKKVLDRSRRGLHSIDGVIGVGVGPSQRTISGRDAALIEIFTDTKGHGKIPGEINGVETKITPIEGAFFHRL